MKKTFLAVCIGGLFFAGCKEVPPDIILTVAAASVDTTYMKVPPASTDPHNVLVEEFTGQSCANCPAGHAILDNAAASNPGRVNIIGLFEHDGSTVTTPPGGAAYDFTSLVALAIGNSAVYNSVPGLPNGGIDRVPYLGFPGNLIPDADWSGDIAGRLNTVDSLNMTISSAYTSSTGVATITATVIYTQTMSTKQSLGIVVVADSIIDFQEEPLGKTDSFYLFNSVFVGMVTAVPCGDPLIDSISVKDPGRFVQLVYTYTVPTTFSSGMGVVNPAHCRVVAFVNSPGYGGSYQVLQSEQTKLMGP